MSPRPVAARRASEPARTSSEPNPVSMVNVISGTRGDGSPRLGSRNVTLVTARGPNRVRATALEPDMNPPLADFTSAEKFACRLTFGMFIRRFLPMIVGMGLALLMIIGLIFVGLGAGALTRPLALLLSAGGTVALTAVKKYQFDKTWGTTELVLSPDGATMAGRHSRLHITWDGIRFLGKADLVRPGRFTFGPLAARLMMELASAAARRPGRPALIGIATMNIAPGTPSLVKSQIGQNIAFRQIDPWTGHTLTAILLTIFDEDWEKGRIGEWIMAYRPDLAPGR
jgi:hypothetical protein